MNGITVVALHLEVFRVSYFPQGTEVFLQASSSKDNTRIEMVRVEMESYGFRVFGKINPTSTCLLRALAYAWSAKRYRPIALCRTQTWGIIKDEQGYHHLLPTPKSESMRQTKVASSLDTTSTLSTTTLAFR